MTMPALGSEGLPNVGDLFEGKYRIEKLVGKGGMGAVFAAHHTLLDQRVAVKFLLGDMVSNPEAARRFNNEAKAAAKIKGEHICRVLDFGQSPTGLPFMVMEFLEGMDLAALVEQRGALPVEEAVDYVLQALEAIAQAHKHGMVHRDLKPANLYLARTDEGKQLVKVLDFGISKASNPFSQTGNHSLTSTKSMLGSPLYMSPEQLRSAKNVDQRADIWSIGVILFELLTGRVPFNGESLGELFVAILEQQTPRVSQLRGDIPQVLDEAIGRCLQRPLEQRWPNVGELAAALAPCAPARAVISVEKIFATLGMQQPAPFPVASMPQEGSYSGYQPPPRPPMPSTHGNTGSGQFSKSNPQQMMTQPLPQSGMGGAIPPTTQDAWGRTGSGTHDAPPAANRLPLFIGLGAGGLVFVGLLAVGGYILTHRTPKDDPSAALTSTATSPPPPPTTPTATTDPTPTTPSVAGTTTGPVATDSATVHPVPTGKTTGTHTSTTATAKPTATTTAPATTSAPAPKPTSTGTAFDPFAAGRHG
jgi:serine/threonine-protein kinase